MTFVFNACDWVVTSFPIIQQWVPVMTGKAERPKLLCKHCCEFCGIDMVWVFWVTEHLENDSA